MQDWVEIVKANDEYIQVQLLDEKWFDATVFEKMEVDECALRCTKNESKNVLLNYHIGNYVSLKEVLSQYSFEQKDGYLFLMKLIEELMACSKNKPVLIDLPFVFVDPYGRDFKFMVVPICVEKWMNQKEMINGFIKDISDLFNTQSSYEIPGYLSRLIKSEECTLMNGYLGIQALYQIRYPKKRFFHRKEKPFIFEYPIKKEHVETIKIQEEVFEMENNQRTQLIGTDLFSQAYLDVNGEVYHILNETTLIGRSMSCDIRFQENDVSAKHAKISSQQQRYYIQDLRSSNGTYLNDKRVQRKMRLRTGMKLRFGSVECEFKES